MARSILDPFVDDVREWLLEGLTNEQIADRITNELGESTTESSVRRLIDRHPDELDQAASVRNTKRTLMNQSEAEGIQRDGDSVTITDAATWERRPVSTLTVEDLLERHDLDPDEWDVKNTLVNQWEANAGDGQKIPLFQFKVWFIKKVPVEVVYPFVPPMAQIARPVKQPRKDGVRLGVIPTDPHAPFQLDPLIDVFQQWMSYNRPDFGVWGGDLLDNGYISRHRDDPAWNATVHECVQSAGMLLLNTINSSPETEWSLIKGNHDDRIRNEQLERNERLYGVTQAQWPGEEPGEWVYSLNHLLRLKELGIEYIEPLGTYDFQYVPITDKLAVRHGHKTVQGGALKTAIELGHSIVLGHTHRQSVGNKTLWNAILRTWEVVTAIEAGCLCQIEGGMGYANGGTPDWQPGFATVTVFPDGGFTFDLARYEQDGILRWRDQKFTV